MLKRALGFPCLCECQHVTQSLTFQINFYLVFHGKYNLIFKSHLYFAQYTSLKCLRWFLKI